MSDKQNKKSFWTTLPGILTGLAALLTAIGSLLTVLNATGVLQSFLSSPVTGTPIAISSPTLTPSARPTSTVGASCSIVAGSFLAKISQDSSLSNRLGCPITPDRIVGSGEMLFERGNMFWREDIDVIYVIYQDHTWERYINSWKVGDNDYSCKGPPTPPTPIRGFGKVWCSIPNVASRIGNGTDIERGAKYPIQDFQSGIVYSNQLQALMILFQDGTWTTR